jgi:hypothetical protein
MALEVAGKEENVVIADLIADFLQPLGAVRELSLRPPNALSSKPINRRKTRFPFELPKKMTFAEAAELGQLAGTPGTLQVAEHLFHGEADRR